MTISSTTQRASYTGNGVTTAFSFPYPFQAQADIVVVETVIATGVQTTKSLTSHYTISGTPDDAGRYPNGGTINAVTAPASTVTWTIYNDPSPTQETDLVENDPLPAETLEAALDKLTILAQRLNDRVNRSVQQPEGDSSAIARLPAKVARAGKYLAFDSNGDPTEAAGTADATVHNALMVLLHAATTAADARDVLGAPASGAVGSSGLTMTTSRLLGRSTASTGAVEEITIGANLTLSSGELSATSSSPNHVINPDGAVNQRQGSSLTDDTYGPDRWYALTQTGAIAYSQLTDPENGYPFGIRLTQSQASAQRFGFAQIIEGKNCKSLRGQTGVLVPRVRISNSQAIRYAILGWTGTEDSVTSDVVSDWTSASYTAGGFFLGSNLSVLAVGSQTPSANTWTSLTALSGSLGSSFNNIVLFVWTEGTAAQNVTFDWDYVYFGQGTSTPSAFPRRMFGDEVRLCQRYYQKSYDLGTAPGSTAGDITAGAVGTLPNNGNNIQAAYTHFITQMRGAPTMRFWDRDGNANKVSSVTSAGTYTDNRTPDQATILIAASNNGFSYAPGVTGVQELYLIHFDAVAEL